MKKDLLSMLPEEIEKEISELGIPRYRADQIVNWLGKGTRSFEEMKNLPAALRNELSEKYSLYRPKVLKKEISNTDGTCKYLW